MRNIIHLDLDAFFCAVEEQNNPELKGKPFAVGGRPEDRGVVSSCSYSARRLGVRSAMPMGKALRLCPGLRIIPAHHTLYREISRKVMEQLHAVSDLVEPVSIDEAFVDISDLPGDPIKIAYSLQEKINQQLGLPCSIGLASNKLVSKIANDFGKTSSRSEGPPNAITVVPHGDEASFLAPLPVEALWGIGPKTAEKLAEAGIYTIGDLANSPEKILGQMFGKTGFYMVERARGIDDSPIVTEHALKSISQEITFPRDVRDEAHLHATILQLSNQVGYRLRGEGLNCKTVKIKIRWPDFTTITRQKSSNIPIDQDNEIAAIATQMFHNIWKTGSAVRLIGIGVSHIQTQPLQLSLWTNNPPARSNSDVKDSQVDAIVKELQERFGSDIVHRGVNHKS